MNKRLQNILQDRTSGASTLYRQTLELFTSDKSFHSQMSARKAVSQLKIRFPEMAVFFYLDQQLKNLSGTPVVDRFYELKTEADNAVASICKAVARYWKKPRRIIILSRSSVVTAIINSRRDFVISVLISESSPKKEGIQTAKELAKQGIKVELVADAAIPGMIQRTDLILLGADSIGKDYIVNKTGTYPLALAADRKKAPVYVIAEPFKRLPKNLYPPEASQQPPSEICKTSSKYLKITNRYFEKVPVSLITKIITG